MHLQEKTRHKWDTTKDVKYKATVEILLARWFVKHFYPCPVHVALNLQIKLIKCTAVNNLALDGLVCNRAAKTAVDIKLWSCIPHTA